jgi:DNA repair protein RecO (recombination protein O)
LAPLRTAAVLLRSHDYGDTSKILRFYTRDQGLLSVMARGVRGRSGKGTTAVSSFASGELIAYVKPQRDLQTMKDFHCTQLREGLGADVLSFAGASAVAELLLAHAERESHPELFDALEQALDRLVEAEGDRIPSAALSAVWRVTEAFGFAPELDLCVECGTALGEDEVGRFDAQAGGIRCAICAEDAVGPRVGPGARAQLRGLLTGDPELVLTHARRHLALLSDFVAFHVASRPINSLVFLGDLLPADESSVQ